MFKRRILALLAMFTLTTALTGAIFDCGDNSDCEVFCDDD